MPYDVVSTEQAREEISSNSLSFMRVVRSDGQFGCCDNPSLQQIFERSRYNFEAFVEQGVFVQDKLPSFFIYRLQHGDHYQTGLVSLVAVADYQNGLIKIHENTRPDKEAERCSHLLETGLHAEPVLLIYQDYQPLQQLIAENTKQAALYDFEAADGIRHALWPVMACSEIEKIAAALERLYIADGHHRAAAAVRCYCKLVESGAKPKEVEKSAHFPAVLFAASELRILPYNRIIRRSELGAEELLAKLKADFLVEKVDYSSPEKGGELLLYLTSGWYRLTPLAQIDATAQEGHNLDVELLFERILRPIFGVSDQRTDTNLKFIGGIDGTSKMQELVDAGMAYCAFSLFPVSSQQLLSVADQNRLMPPKSTWFEPKLRSGLFVHRFREYTAHT